MITILNPLDQPTSNLRLIDKIKESMSEEAGFDSLRFVVAYAKSGIIENLSNDFKRWKDDQKESSLLVGIDQKVTSKEALQQALKLFNSVFIINHKSVTFHPKIYLFRNKAVGRIILGSNNLTTGGLELNFESAVVIDCDLSKEDEQELFNNLWRSTKEVLSEKLGISQMLDDEILRKLSEEKLLAIEKKIPGTVDSSSNFSKRSKLLDDLFKSNFSVKRSSPARQQPKKQAQNGGERTAGNSEQLNDGDPQLVEEGASYDVTSSFETFVIQIIPHHNGEVLLSKTAINENPKFFGFPFTGETTPKKGHNSGYPQLEPDPVV